MIDTPANRDQLLDVFAAIASQFASDKDALKRREDELKGQLQRMEAARALSPWHAQNEISDAVAAQLAGRCKEGIEQLLGTWLSSVANLERNTSLRKDFDDSLLIYVYGKVKAGKSSLGNYLAYGHSKPGADVIDNAQPKPEFFWREGTDSAERMTAERMRQQRCFGVDVIEATSSIQGFRLPGLTWIDSPGVHSVNAENGQLASDYVASADLVLFLSNSGSPGRSTDQIELRTLIQKKKKLMVLITGSDEISPDENEFGEVVQTLVMKSRHDRDDQIEYFSEEVAKLGLSLDSMKVHSVSVNYAEAGSPAEQVPRWQESGMADFAAEISDIACSSGLALKRQTPLRNLQVFCNSVLGAIEELERELKHISTELQDARHALKVKVDSIMNRLKHELPGQIDLFADKHAMDNDGFSAACRQLFDSIFHGQASELCESIGQKFEDIRSHEGALGPLMTPVAQFSQRRKKVTYKSRLSESVGGAGGAALGGWGGAEGGAALGTMIMPGIGTVVGGLLGAAVGSWVGSKAGGAAGEQFNSTQEIDVIIGDNREEVSLDTRQQLLRMAENRLTLLYEQLDNLCYVAIDVWLHNFSRELRAMRRLTLRHINEIEQELNHGIA
ncbi:dynamin family protein [Pseudomonas sp. LM20]|uniref:dynamin family protein n=1 Tax=Pseudomonas sp. LM20 TaxID=2899116 RepID=UPI001F2C2AF6|nr:dynamin family protein [Pseudomonas sp. LM20]MCE5989549.1 dynamin family protein [Pseudomonas sp. LM20]